LEDSNPGNQQAVPNENDHEALVATMKKAAAALRDAGVPHVLAGGLASWARGGPQSGHDVDFLVRPEDAERALQALVDAGLRAERPPEGWLLKAYDGDVLVDLIFEPSGGPVTDAEIERGEELEVVAMPVRVSSLEDVLVAKLLALDEPTLDYHGVLEIARAVREQVDWDDVRARTQRSPFARGFFTIAEGLDIVTPPAV
jgi:hypothetical protein